MKKGTSRTKVEVLSKDCIFHTIFQTKYQMWGWIWHIHDKNSIFLQQMLHYSQIYKSTFNHDHKFETIIMLKEIWVAKSKKGMSFYFLTVLNTWILFLGNILTFTKKLKQFDEHLIMKKDFWNKKTTCPHVFF